MHRGNNSGGKEEEIMLIEEREKKDVKSRLGKHKEIKLENIN